MGFFWTIVALVVALGLTWRYLGSYMAAVFEGRVHFLGWAERPVYRLLGTGPEQEQTWKRYAGSLVIFSAVSIGFTYLLIRIQGSLPLNPQHLGAVPPALSFNTAASFMTNTNWQNYGGETTMSYFSQIGALTVEQFVSPAVGIAVAIALVRGFSRRNSPTIGNFWVDITRCILYILLPIAFVVGIIFVGQGAVQTLAGPVHVHDVAERGHPDHRPWARSASWRRSSSSATTVAASSTPTRPPLREPDRPHQLALDLPAACPSPSPSPTPSARWWGASATAPPCSPPWCIIFGVWVGFTSYAEHQQNPAVAAAGVHADRRATPRARRSRFGDTTTALFGVASTSTSTGSADGSYDSFTPMGGFGLLTGMMLGEVDAGWYRERPVHHPHLRHHRRVHRRPDDRANAGVPGQEDPGQGGEAGRARRPGHADHRAHPHRDRRVDPRRPGRAAERGPPRVHRDPLRAHLAGQQQRVGLRRPDRQHRLLQRHRRASTC